MSYYNTENNRYTNKFCAALKNKDISIPLEINTQRRFCVWKAEKKENTLKPSKIPYYQSNNLMRRLDIRNKELWIDIEQALEVKESKLADGIGLILLDSDVFVLDLDNCYNFNTKQLSNFAQEIIEHFNDTDIEISPSNQGLHAIGLGQLELNKKSRSPNI